MMPIFVSQIIAAMIDPRAPRLARATVTNAMIDKLEANRPALQAALSRHVVLKYTPHLIFHHDESIKRGARVLEILDDLGKRDGQDE